MHCQRWRDTSSCHDQPAACRNIQYPHAIVHHLKQIGHLCKTCRPRVLWTHAGFLEYIRSELNYIYFQDLCQWLHLSAARQRIYRAALYRIAYRLWWSLGSAFCSLLQKNCVKPWPLCHYKLDIFLIIPRQSNYTIEHFPCRKQLMWHWREHWLGRILIPLRSCWIQYVLAVLVPAVRVYIQHVVCCCGLDHAQGRRQLIVVVLLKNEVVNTDGNLHPSELDQEWVCHEPPVANRRHIMLWYVISGITLITIVFGNLIGWNKFTVVAVESSPCIVLSTDSSCCRSQHHPPYSRSTYTFKSLLLVYNHKTQTSRYLCMNIDWLIDCDDFTSSISRWDGGNIPLLPPVLFNKRNYCIAVTIST